MQRNFWISCIYAKKYFKLRLYMEIYCITYQALTTAGKFWPSPSCRISWSMPSWTSAVAIGTGTSISLGTGGGFGHLLMTGVGLRLTSVSILMSPVGILMSPVGWLLTWLGGVMTLGSGLDRLMTRMQP